MASENIPRQWFILGDGIERQVISADIQRYLGPESTVRPGVGTGENRGAQGYWIKASTDLTRVMIADLRAASERWRQEHQRHTYPWPYVGSETYEQGVASRHGRVGYFPLPLEGLDGVSSSAHHKSERYNESAHPNNSSIHSNLEPIEDFRQRADAIKATRDALIAKTDAIDAKLDAKEATIEAKVARAEAVVANVAPLSYTQPAKHWISTSSERVKAYDDSYLPPEAPLFDDHMNMVSEEGEIIAERHAVAHFLSNLQRQQQGYYTDQSRQGFRDMTVPDAKPYAPDDVRIVPNSEGSDYPSPNAGKLTSSQISRGQETGASLRHLHSSDENVRGLEMSHQPAHVPPSMQATQRASDQCGNQYYASEMAIEPDIIATSQRRHVSKSDLDNIVGSSGNIDKLNSVFSDAEEFVDAVSTSSITSPDLSPPHYVQTVQAHLDLPITETSPVLRREIQRSGLYAENPFTYSDPCIHSDSRIHLGDHVGINGFSIEEPQSRPRSVAAQAGTSNEYREDDALRKTTDSRGMSAAISVSSAHSKSVKPFAKDDGDLVDDMSQDAAVDADPPGTYGPTVPDSGYHSASKSKEFGSYLHSSEEDDALSIMSDDRTSVLPSKMKQRLEAAFTQELLSDLDIPSPTTEQEIEAFVLSLRGLLRRFAILLRCRAASRVEETATTFVRHSRLRICQQAQVQMQASQPRNDLPGGSVMSAAEKFARWDLDPSSRDWPARSGDAPETDEDSDVCAEFDLTDIPDSAEARAFLVDSEEYQWLLQQIRSASSMDTPKSSRAQDISSEIMKTLVRNDDKAKAIGQQLEVDIEWSPITFLADHFSEITAAKCSLLGPIIVLLGDAVDCYATTCTEYLTTVWSTYGSFVLSSVEEATKSDTRTAYKEFKRASLDITVNDSRTKVRASGPAVALMEIAEIVIWLGCACRQSVSPDLMMYASPRLIRNDPKRASFEIRYDVEVIPSPSPTEDELVATCWRQMFQNPVIASGYTVPARKNGEKGLELTPAMLSILSQAPRAVTFAGKFFLKGFNSIVAPLKRLGSSTQWHFYVDKERRRLPYNLCLDHIISSCWDDVFFAGARHFVGWCPSVRFLAGTNAKIYDDIEYSRTQEADSGLGVESAFTISAGKIVNVGCKIVRGTRDTPAYLRAGPFEQQIDRATEWSVVFCDTTSRRHWLLDGATTILHLARAWLSRKHVRYAPKGVADQIHYEIGTEGGPDSSYDILTSKFNRRLELLETQDANIGERPTWWTFQDLVQQIWENLEHMRDLLQTPRVSETLNFTFKKRLIIGFDFKDILRGSSPLKPRTLQLGSGAAEWMDLTNRIGAITILGSNFGELLMPSQPSRLTVCGLQTALPPDHDFLAIPLCVLKNVICRHCRHTNHSVHLAGRWHWINSEKCFAQCQCGHSPSNMCSAVSMKLVQNHTSKCGQGSQLTADKSVFQDHPHGAIVMGYISGKIIKNKPVEPDCGNTLKRRRISSDVHESRSRQPDSGVALGSSSESSGQPATDEAYGSSVSRSAEP